MSVFCGHTVNRIFPSRTVLDGCLRCCCLFGIVITCHVFYMHVFRGILLRAKWLHHFRDPPMSPELLPRFRAPPAATPRSRPSRFQPSSSLPPRGAALTHVPRHASPCFQPPARSPPSFAASSCAGRFKRRFQSPIGSPLPAASSASHQTVSTGGRRDST